MRICFIGAGNSIHIQRWMHFFQRQGATVYLISTSTHGASDSNQLRFQAGGIYRIPVLRSLYRIGKCLRYIKEVQPDLIHLHAVNLLGFVKAFFPRIPFVVSPWGYEIYVLAEQRVLFRQCAGWILRQADGITTTTEAMQAHIIERFGVRKERVNTFCWGIDYELFAKADAAIRLSVRQRLGVVNDAPVFLVNRYFPASDFRLLWEGFQTVLKTHSAPILIVIKGVTDDTVWSQARSYAERLAVADHIRWIDQNISVRDMAEYIQASDIFLNIVSSDQRSSSLLEAMAGGLIPLVNDLPAYREFLIDGDNAVFVEHPDADRLTNRMVYVIEHLQQLQEKFVVRNRAYVKKHSNRRIQEEQMRDFYLNILKQYTG